MYLIEYLKKINLLILIPSFVGAMSGLAYSADTKPSFSIHFQRGATCAEPSTAPVQSPRAHHHSQLIHISADSAEALPQQDVLQLQGQVHITQGEQYLQAEQAILDRRQQHIQASGQVLLQQPQLQLQAARADYNLQHQTGQAQQVAYYLPELSARGTAAQATLTSADRSQYQDISYTTCPSSDQAWSVRAIQLELDQKDGWGTMHHARLNFLGLPLGYIPWLRFPLDERRHSGFLPPDVGYNSTHGVQIALPYYINLAPNYDLTLTPRWMSRRGMLLGSQWRYLTPTMRGTLALDYLPHDQQHLDAHRGRLAYRSTGQHTEHLSSKMHIDYVSDDDYLTDLGRKLSLTSTTLLPRQALLRYQTDAWDVQAEVKDYQVLNQGSQPYRLLPQIRLRHQAPTVPNEFNYQLTAELSQFDKPGNTAIEGTRLDVQPRMSLPLQASYYHLTPSISTRYTQYHLRNPAMRHDRLTGSFGLDAGLYFERPMTYGTQPSIQTLAPRLYYHYTPATTQDALPLFDTAAQSFSTNSLFRANRFTGADRVGDTNQLAFALSTRINHRQNYHEYLRASLGQIYYFRDRTVTLPGTTPETTKTSAIVGDIQAQIGHYWQTGGNLTWDPHTNTLEQLSLQADYRPDDAHRINLAYRQRADLTQHADLAVRWPLTEQTQLIARWHYDLAEHRTREAIAGIEYQHCCWRVRAVMREHLQDSEQTEQSFLLQLELNGLGKLGSDINSLLGDL